MGARSTRRVKVPPVAGPTARPGVRAQTLRGQWLANRMVRACCAHTLVCRVAGHRLITVYVVGRRTGRHYAVPVAYTRHDGDLLIGTSFAWGRNLRSGEPVDIRLRGRRRTAEVRVVTNEPDVVALYAVIVRDNPNFAAFNDIGSDQDGNPSPTDLQLAWRPARG